MADQILGNLAWLIKGDTTDFDKNLDKSETKVERFGKNAQKVGASLTKNITLPIIAVGAAFVGLAVKAGNAADKLLDLEQITGLSTDTLQELEFVSAEAGVNFDGLVGVVSKFTNLLPSLESGTSEGAKAFTKLGVELRDADGQLRSTEELFPELIKGLQGITNETERNSTAQKIFGRDLTNLAPVLGFTADEFDNLLDAARESGTILGKDSLLAANDFRVEVDQLKLSIQKTALQIGADFAPVLKDTLLPLVIDAASVLGDLLKGFASLNPETQKTILAVAGVAAAIGPVIGVIGKATTAAKLLSVALAGPAGIAIAVGAAAAGIIALGVSYAETAAERKIFNDTIQDAETAVENLSKVLPDLANDLSNAGIKAFEQAVNQKKANLAIAEAALLQLELQKALADADYDELVQPYLDAFNQIPRPIETAKETAEAFTNYLRDYAGGEFGNAAQKVGILAENIATTEEAINAANGELELATIALNEYTPAVEAATGATDGLGEALAIVGEEIPAAVQGFDGVGVALDLLPEKVGKLTTKLDVLNSATALSEKQLALQSQGFNSIEGFLISIPANMDVLTNSSFGLGDSMQFLGVATFDTTKALIEQNEVLKKNEINYNKASKASRTYAANLTIVEENGINLNAVITDTSNTIKDEFNNALVKIGGSLSEGAASFQSFADIAIDSIGAILESLGAQLLAEAAIALVRKDYEGAALAGAAGAAALIASGAIAARARPESAISAPEPLQAASGTASSTGQDPAKSAAGGTVNIYNTLNTDSDESLERAARQLIPYLEAEGVRVG